MIDGKLTNDDMNSLDFESLNNTGFTIHPA